MSINGKIQQQQQQEQQQQTLSKTARTRGKKGDDASPQLQYLPELNGIFLPGEFQLSGRRGETSVELFSSFSLCSDCCAICRPAIWTKERGEIRCFGQMFGRRNILLVISCFLGENRLLLPNFDRWNSQESGHIKVQGFMTGGERRNFMARSTNCRTWWTLESWRRLREAV